MRWKSHVRFGGRAAETHSAKAEQGAPARPLHLRLDPGRLRVHQLRHRRVLPPHPRLARLGLQGDAAGHVRARAGAVHPPPSRRPVHLQGPGPPLRRRIAARPSASPKRSSTPGLRHRSAPSATPSTTRSSNPRSGSTRPSSSNIRTGPTRGPAGPKSNERPPAGSTGTTRRGSTTRSARRPRSSSKSTTASPTPPTSTRLPKTEPPSDPGRFSPPSWPVDPAHPEPNPRRRPGPAAY